MSLVEICTSKYKHAQLEVFGKKYYKQLNGDKRICAECIDAYVEEVSAKVFNIIMKCLNNINMQDSVKVNDSYREDEVNITTNISISNYWEYHLPIKYSVKANLFCKEYVEEVSIMNIENNVDTKETHYKLGLIQISSINCPDMFPTINMSLDIRDTDSSDRIKDLIQTYLGSYIMATFEELPDEMVKVIMDNYTSTTYQSACSCAATSSASGCSKCGGNINGEHYIYNNSQYCLDCMFELVVSLANANNITDDVGLSSDALSMNSSSYAIVNTPEWKRSVISKYENVMNELGVRPNIVHVQMTLS